MAGANFTFSYSTVIVRRFGKNVHMNKLTPSFPLVVMTKPKEKDGVTKYHVNRRVSEFQSFVSHFIPTRKNHSLFHWTCSRSSILPTRQHNEAPDSSAALLRRIETNCPAQPAYHRKLYRILAMFIPLPCITTDDRVDRPSYMPKQRILEQNGRTNLRKPSG